MSISIDRGSKAAPQLNRLIEQLNRFVRLIEADIDEEERRMTDVSNPTYPASVRTLHLRKDNLLATISTLKAKLADFPR